MNDVLQDLLTFTQKQNDNNKPKAKYNAFIICQDLKIPPHRRTPGTQSHPERTGKGTGERKLSKDTVTNCNCPRMY